MALTTTNEYTRFMVEAYSDIKNIMAPTAFQGAFFGVPETGAKTHFITDKKSVEIDIQRANGRRLAQMVHRGTGANEDGRVKKTVASRFENVAFAWPLIESQGAINSKELLDRSIGMNPYENETMQDRLTEKALEIHTSHFNEQVSTMEFLAKESLFNGTHPAILGTTNTGYIYDFGRTAGNKITVSTAWTNAAADILGDLDNAVNAIQQNGLLVDRNYGCILDVAAYAGLKKNTQILSDSDVRRFNFGTLDSREPVPANFMRYVNNGFQPRGWIETTKGRVIWLFTYELTYTDDFTSVGTDTEKNWVPAGKALIFHPNARCDRYFGPMDRMPILASEMQEYREMFGFDMSLQTMAEIQNGAVIDPRMFYTFADRSKKVIDLTTQSSVILPTTRTDAFATLSGLV